MRSDQVKILQLSFNEIFSSLKQGSFGLKVGTLVFRCRSDLLSVARSIHTLYQHHPYQISPEFADFDIEVTVPMNLRRWLRPQAEFLVEGGKPFEPLPKQQAPALFEWGMNWLIAASSHHCLSIHAASLERNGDAVILPAPPGSGKSTLCAALAFSKWRLLSDELTLLDLSTLQAQALARPINLKNTSIDLIREFVPEAVWSPEVYDTLKGRVTHLAPPEKSVDHMLEMALPRWIIFPKYEPNAEPQLSPRSKAQTAISLADNAFNYSILGENGFELVSNLVDRCDCYDFVYSRIEDAIDVFDWLVETAK